jgi:protein-disulfide isomerase
MTSGKKARRQRRTPAPPPVRSTGGGRKASPKVLAIAVGVIALAAVAIVLAVVLGNGGSSNPATTNARTLPDARAVAQLFRAIPQHGTTLGSPKAPVTMVEYIDLQCPFCRDFELNVLPGILRKHVRSGKLQIQARPVAFIGQDSQRGRDAALAAAAQNHFFDFVQLLYLNQGSENTGWLNDSIISSAFASIRGLNVQEAQSARSSSLVKAQAARFDRQAIADRLSGTPMILVGKTGGRLAVVQSSLGAISSAIEKALR